MELGGGGEVKLFRARASASELCIGGLQSLFIFSISLENSVLFRVARALGV